MIDLSFSYGDQPRNIQKPIGAKKHPKTRVVMTPYIFLAPLLVLLFIFFFAPATLAVTMAFFKVDILAGEARYSGLANFLKLYRNGEVSNSIWVTLRYACLTVPSSVLGGLLAALAIHHLNRGKAFWRAIFFLPVAATLVAMSVVWRWMFLPQTGLIDRILEPLFGISDWLNSIELALPAIAIVGNWQQIGFVTVLFLAGLAAIPRDVLEAARVDGAGPFNRFFHVTWPALGPTTVFATVVTTMHALKVFDTVAAMTTGGPSGATETLAYLMWQRGIYFFDLGGGAVVTLVLLVLVLAVTAVQIHATATLEAGGER